MSYYDNMSNEQLLQQVNELKKNPKLLKVMDVFEYTQKIYERTIRATTIHQRPMQKGTYSSSISKKNYYANISTNTQ